MSHVCVVAPVHVWDDVRVYRKQVLSLLNSGYSVSLIARESEHCSVVDARVTFFPQKKFKSKVKRFSNLVSVFIKALKQNADVYHIHNPDTLPIGLVLKLFGKKVIYDTHEDFSLRILTRKWIPKAIRIPVAFLIAKTESLFCKYVFDGAICTQKQLLSRLGKKAILLGNAPIISDIHPSRQCSKVDLSKNGEFRLVYIGSITTTRGIIELVDALEQLNRTSSVRLWLIGPCGDDTLDLCSKKTGWTYVDYLPYIEQKSAFEYVAQSDLGIVTILDVGDHSQTDPNKIYEYMACGIPFLATNFPLWQRKFESHKCGWFCSPTVDSLVNHIQSLTDKSRLLVERGTNGKSYVLGYNWEIEFDKLLSLYRKIDVNSRD
jgi:glycosyltransferase involved in cell wall biosynthesis